MVQMLPAKDLPKEIVTVIMILYKNMKTMVHSPDGNTEFVEKRKISYFGLALNLFRHLISTNQDD